MDLRTSGLCNIHSMLKTPGDFFEFFYMYCVDFYWDSMDQNSTKILPYLKEDVNRNGVVASKRMEPSPRP